MKAMLLLRTRIAYSDTAFAELVAWRVPKPLGDSAHMFKYRLAYIVDSVYVVRYDNQVGKGDRRHFGEKEHAYDFETPDKLIVDFQRDIARGNREDLHA